MGIIENKWIPYEQALKQAELYPAAYPWMFKPTNMKVITEGHKYIAQNFENPENGQTIQFIEKVPVNSSGGLKTENDGTTNEQLMEILIDRLQYLQSKFPCKENACCITHLEEGLMWLEKRTRDRIKRGVEGTNNK